ncbi:beta-1,3-galactosyltransferase 5 [Leptinotarsa decemlineata]|uniref:beta-1,3-galactosyltransferase 5 n=1 Tax=Leptinotarsa decemlineata TaxID=7539 RepID=UPI000C2541F6|nr:beta-1,3-galactosyltransferase 5-like [Leptinotarsa decemlineata]XP_023015848.1 beta-1,3-galactosyltransferase 5-like [Leptinotarsa decemlineata]
MLERRLWSNIGLLLIAFFAFLGLWHTFVSSRFLQVVPTSTTSAYTLYTESQSGYPSRALQLPERDYNQLIDLNFNFSIVNFICNDSQPLLLLVLVHSSPSNFAKRKTIRETWGQKDENIKVLFLIGSVTSSDLQKTLEDENRLHNDFVQGTFLDTYRNITYKHVMAFKYSIYHCPQAKYILKTDDDVFVNMPTMMNFLKYDLSPYGAENVLFCTPRRNSKVLRSYRSKWRVSFAEYPDRIYPTYCPGWTLLYSPDVVFALYKEAQKAAYFWIDDIHITGTLIKKINVVHTDIESLVLSQWNLYKIVSFYYNVSDPFLYGRANMKQSEIRALWKFVKMHDAPKYIFRDFH